MNPTKEQITEWFKGLQDDICQGLEALDGRGTFVEDHWNRPGGGGGRSRVIEGQLIEKGGVNFSAVFGQLPAQAAKLEMEPGEFYATGVSIVLHPSNPHVPIIHMNVRYFESGDQWWLGGGIDLTPHYISLPHAKLFHEHLQHVCDQHHESFYPKFKPWADEYFYLKHRQETRGIGGIFFDRLHSNSYPLEKSALWAFVQDVGSTFAPIYTTQVDAFREKSFTPQEREWQLLRRGRYVEFNLVWDRGTRFGLETNGRTESILMSLPAQANWVYNYQAEPGSPEAETLRLLGLKGKLF